MAVTKEAPVPSEPDEPLRPNPWLSIPARDYLGHMASPEVDQLSVLVAIFRSTVGKCRPGSLLVLGCSTGNGWEHIDPAVTRRVVGIDVNDEYLAVLRERLPSPVFDLELRCEDLATADLPSGEFDLVHGALILEYVDWRPLLPRLTQALRPAGTLSIVLQLPSPTLPAITPSAYPSLRRLEPLFRFVEPGNLLAAAQSLGFRVQERCEVLTPSGKALLALAFRR
jgi:SAM-dependent methyltransferase